MKKSLPLFLFCLVLLAGKSAIADLESIEIPSDEIAVSVTADPPLYRVEEVTRDLVLIGKGIKNSNGEVLALTCFTSTCDQAKMVYFNPLRKKSYFFGAPILITSDNSAPTPEQIKTAIQKYSDQHRRHRRIYNWRAMGWLKPLSAVGLGLAATFISGGTVWVWIGSGLVIYKIEDKIENGTTTILRKSTLYQLSNKDGWNWAGYAKRVGNGKFEDAFDAIQPQMFRSPGDAKGVRFGGNLGPNGAMGIDWYEDANGRYENIHHFRRP